MTLAYTAAWIHEFNAWSNASVSEYIMSIAIKLRPCRITTFRRHGLVRHGTKSRGPNYLWRFMKSATKNYRKFRPQPFCPILFSKMCKRRLMNCRRRDFTRQQNILPGPTGEANILSYIAKGKILKYLYSVPT